MQGVHLFLNSCRKTECDCLQFVIKRFRCGRHRNNAAEILLGHGNRAVDQIAEHICQIGVNALADQLVGEHTVVCERHLVQNVVVNGIHAEQANQIVRVDNVAERLGHLAVADQQPRMTEYLLGQRLAERHQEDRPVNRVEANDILADQVHVRRPELLVVLIVVAVRIVAAEGDIVGKRIQPNIDNMARVKVYRNAPAERGAGNAQVLQTGLEEVVYHLVLAALRLDELGVLLDVLHQAVGVLAHAEEVCLLLSVYTRAAAVRAAAVLQLAFGPEGLTRLAVFALVRTLVNIALIIQFFEDLLHFFLMHRVGGADEFVIGGVHQIPDGLNLTGNLINVLLRRNAGCLGLLLNLLTMLVRTGLEVNIVTGHALVACDSVGQHNLVGVADVRLRRGIGDRRRDIIGFLVHSCILSLHI